MAGHNDRARLVHRDVRGHVDVADHAKSHVGQDVQGQFGLLG